MCHLGLTLLTALALPSGTGPDTRLFAWGRDPARGVLLNLTTGAGPSDPIDPARPTVVVAHGLNPMAPLVRCRIAECYAEAIGERFGPSVNVLGWDWNAATIRSARPRINDEHAVEQGRALGAALLRLGIEPTGLHLIGQSSGSVVVAAAARVLVRATGRAVARITLLDPVGAQHGLIFGRLGVASCAASVEHYWAPGPSGFGRRAPYPGVHDQAVPAPGGLLGLVRPSRADHLNTVRWHLRRAGP